MSRAVILVCLAFALIQHSANDNHVRKQSQHNAQSPENNSGTPALSQTGPETADQKPSGDASQGKNNEVKVTSLPPEISIKTIKDPIDWTILGCTILLTIVGIVGTCAAIKTLKAINRQAHYMRVHAKHFDKLAKATANQLTEMSTQSGILQESVVLARDSAKAAKQNLALLINKERARIRTVKPENLSLEIGKFVAVEFKLLFYGTTPAYEVKSEVHCTISESRDSSTSSVPHRIHDLPTVVSSSDIKPIYRDLLMQPFLLDDVTLDKIAKLEMFIHFGGIIKYNDFMEEPRETAFHYRWNAANSSPNSIRRRVFHEGWEEVGGDKDNYYT